MTFSIQRQEEITRVLRFRGLPYDPFRRRLYSVDELMDGYTPEKPERSLDARIAAHFRRKSRKLPDIHEALGQRIHDHAIESALYRFVNLKNKPARKIVGVMGSHSTARDTAEYAETAKLCWMLVNKGFSVATGGGPGIMEAGNLGAYLASYTPDDLRNALTALARVPRYPGSEPAYIAAASEVRAQYKDSGQSLAIPTWAYADEPTGQFSSAIGKYFANSIREDGLLAIAAWGIVFAPGSAGTLQEVFQDLAHNSYWSFHSRGPMVFLGKSFFGTAPSVFDVARNRAKKDGYDDMLALVDTAQDAVDFILSHPMIPQPQQQRTFGLSNVALAAD